MKKTLKAVICIALCSVMLFSLIACVSTNKVIICFHCGHENAASTKFCSNCGTKFEIVTSNTATSSDDNTTTETEHIHAFSDATCTEPPKCACGATNGEPLGHSLGSATCTESAKCSRCGETNGEPLGHDWGEAACTASATCSRCNATSGQPLGHKWQDATCTSSEKCSRCGKTNGSPLGHNWSQATCTSGRKCANCKKTDGTPLGHEWNNATCSESATCKRCGTSSGGPLGHDWISATCTEPRKCSRCKRTDGSAKGHSYQSVVTPPTCTEKGYTTYTCACGDTYTADKVAAKGHSYAERVTPPTCTKKGYTTYTCSCGDTYVSDYTNTAHSYHNYVCSSCGAVDKTHAYEFLTEWVKNNGIREGSNISYIIDENTNSEYTLTYSIEYDNLILTYSSIVGNELAYTQVNLDSYFYGFSFLGNKVMGYLDAETYTEGTTLSCTSYTGATLDKARTLELASTSVNVLIECLKYCLLVNQLPISVADLGFSSY